MSKPILPRPQKIARSNRYSLKQNGCVGKCQNEPKWRNIDRILHIAIRELQSKYGVRSLVGLKRLTVTQEIAGSNPVGHPI